MTDDMTVMLNSSLRFLNAANFLSYHIQLVAYNWHRQHKAERGQRLARLEGRHRLVQLDVPLVDVLVLVDAGQIAHRDRAGYDRVRAAVDGRQRMESALQRWQRGRCELGQLRKRPAGSGRRRTGRNGHRHGSHLRQARLARHQSRVGEAVKLTLERGQLREVVRSHEGSSSAENDVNEGMLCWVVSSAVLALIIELTQL
uniref:Uncharacterized protein n=1 Tax=Anopheles atroparvus TaxID=41427 RepID=A0A182J683_ANOAO